MSDPMAKMLRWVPVFVLAASIIGSFSVMQFQMQAYADDIKDNEEDIEDNEEEIDTIQRLLIRQQGDQKVAIEELKGDIKSILQILKEGR